MKTIAAVANSAAAVPDSVDPNLAVQKMLPVTKDGNIATGRIVWDTTGQYSFDLSSLPSSATYDASGNISTITYGPDTNGRSIRKTSTWINSVWQGDSAWVLV